MHRMPVQAPTAPDRVPLILDWPMRTRVSTGTSAIAIPCWMALTCISTVQPKRVSAMVRRASDPARMGPVRAQVGDALPPQEAGSGRR